MLLDSLIWLSATNVASLSAAMEIYRYNVWSSASKLWWPCFYYSYRAPLRLKFIVWHFLVVQILFIKAGQVGVTISPRNAQNLYFSFVNFRHGCTTHVKSSRTFHRLMYTKFKWKIKRGVNTILVHGNICNLFTLQRHWKAEETRMAWRSSPDFHLWTFSGVLNCVTKRILRMLMLVVHLSIA